ncbi:translation initiation factor IF-2 [Methyloceanibacter methanicus]|uniref:Translation initiation factor IF-2 n=1 Tax=Methyloceanibacter methanicus TaxID=1774968 RepID=A0A1E3W432_9HYPH|nr:translation initiation factor IF-2 [Methyloceanibacter methanicus]ODR99896.1 translation initiation factor IF-2 [Methyloceanibacter methanicus]
MSETNETEGKTGGRKMTLNLRRTVESGHVRQSFSHGRSKSVLVEKKKRRSIGPGGSAAAPAEEAQEKPQAKAPEKEAAPKPAATKQRRSGVVLKQLSEEEKGARAKALADAKIRRAEERERAKEDAAKEAALAEQRAKEAAEAEARRVEEEARQATEAKTEAEAKPKAKAVPKTDDGARRPLAPEKEEQPKRQADARHKKGAATPRRGDERRVRGRLTITNALDEEQRQRSLASLKRHRERQKKQGTGPQSGQKIAREVIIPDVITIQELANRMAERGVDVIKFLMKDGAMHKITDVIDSDTAQLIAEEFGHTVRRVSEADVEEGFIGEVDAEEDLAPRAPIVTIMGHVDHGKTSLLDAIRAANVVSQEAGGITQHIGAYQVTVPSGQKVTFIDTPGHAAFTAMRARGAKVTDIVVLVVAADDGVKPQTIEAINHAKAAEVPIIIAINKIDKPGADPQRVRTELLSHEIVVESMGGDTLEIEVSALKRTNLDALLEAIVLQAEVLELKANADRAAEGVIVEAKLERGRGPVGTALVQRGTLKLGDIIVAGSAWGRVRALINDLGEHTKEAGPSVPVEVLGFDSAPEAGDQFAVVENEARAREITEYRDRERRKTLAVAGQRGSLEQMMNQLQEAGVKEFPLVIKGDVQGSVEAISAALAQLGSDEVRARLVHVGVGGITESDISLATTSGAVVLGFNVRANAQARAAAERDGVEVRYYAVIYDLVDDMRQAMSGLLAPTRRETFLGNAEILEVFNISKVGKVAGCRVTEGKVERGAHVRLIRDNVVIHEGELSTLKRFKDEVKEVVAGQECGMAFEGYQDMREGDVIECFQVEHVQRTL